LIYKYFLKIICAANLAPKCAKLTLSLTSEVSSRTSQKYIENSNNPEGSNKVDMQYKNIIKEFEQLSSLSFDVCISVIKICNILSGKNLFQYTI